MSLSVNFFGHIPFNPNSLPEQKRGYGNYTDRPIGLTEVQMVQLYWTVRSFQVNAGVQSVNTVSELDQFLLGGGFAGTAEGAIAGLAAINQAALGQGDGRLIGHTRILEVIKTTIRKDPVGIVNGMMATTIELDPNQKPNPISSRITEVNEGTLCAAGPVHTLTSTGGYIVIDFSDIIYAKRQYWPKIIVYFDSKSAVCSSTQTGFVSNFQPLGALNFCNYGMISFLGQTNIFPPPITNIQGSVTIGTRCADRFYWDDNDDTRFKDDPCKTDFQSTISPLSPKYINTPIIK